jgi:hypothetical protein
MQARSEELVTKVESRINKANKGIIQTVDRAEGEQI